MCLLYILMVFMAINSRQKNNSGKVELAEQNCKFILFLPNYILTYGKLTALQVV